MYLISEVTIALKCNKPPYGGGEKTEFTLKLFEAILIIISTCFIKIYIYLSLLLTNTVFAFQSSNMQIK